MESAQLWIGIVIGGVAAALPLAAYIVKLTPTKKDDEVMSKLIDLAENLSKKDLDGDSKIGKTE